MSSLTGLIVLLFLLLIATATVTWLTLTARERIERAGRRPAAPPRAKRATTSNDAVRGAKAPRKHAPADSGAVVPPGEAGVRVRPRRTGGDDPFERFLDPDRRRRDD